MTKFSIIFLVIFVLFGITQIAAAHMPKLVYLQKGDIKINNPEFSQAFYDELTGQPRFYFINSDKDFNLYINILVPESANATGRYSANVFSLNNGKEELLYSINGDSVNWAEFYEPFGRDYYLKGPEFEKAVLAGEYKIEIWAAENLGKYVLAVGKQEVFLIPESLNIYWQLPLLKMEFFKTSVLQFFLTPFGIVGISAVFALVIILAILNFIVAIIVEKIRSRGAKTILLTSAGMQMKDEIIKLLQKPAYNTSVGFIKSPDYAGEDLIIMRELGFNVEEIAGLKNLELKDIIFVAGEDLDYFKKNINKKIIKKLLKRGIVYIGSGAGSVVAGKQGMNLVPFDIFVHYRPEHAELIKKKMPFKWQRKKLRILTDEQAILVQGRERILIGKGEKVIV